MLFRSGTMDSINVEQLIEEVHARPAIWDMRDSDYIDKSKRKEAWEEIVTVFVADSATLVEKLEMGKFSIVVLWYSSVFARSEVYWPISQLFA